VNPRIGATTQRGDGETFVQEALLRNLRPGMIFCDLGANVGSFSLLATKLVSPSGSVISFAADPEIAARLHENLAHNKFTHASAEQKTVWSTDGPLSFERVDPNTSPDRGLGGESSAPVAATQTHPR
jgi:FkbM family methyltransferase